MTETREKRKAAAPGPEVEAVMEELATPFEAHEVKFRAGATSGSRALALAYIDARVIQDRLDDVLGAQNWQDEYECLPDGSVVCRLRLRLGGEWITKMDVGGPSEQPDEGDRRKAAFSDALKRAAVKFGVGRYLYRLPQTWVDYDPQKKQLRGRPELPGPKPRNGEQRSRGAEEKKPQRQPSTSPEKVEEKKPAQQPAVSPVLPPPRAAAASAALPANGAELQQRLYAYDATLAKQSVCRQGELVKAVVAAGVKAGFDADLAAWSGPAILLAVEETKAFETRMRQQAAARPREVA